MSQTSNVWKIFAHTNVLTMNITHAHMQIISDAWDTFGITESFGFELIIFRSFSGTAIGEFAVGCGMTLACALSLMPQRHCTMDQRCTAAQRTDENGYGILNQCQVGGISFTVLQRPCLL